jgi:hypothetical protein
MAKKRRGHKKHRSRRKVGAISPKMQSAIEMIAGAILGGFAGRLIYTNVPLPDKVVTIGEAGAGALGTVFLDMPFAKGVSLGLLGYATVASAISLGFLGRVNDIPGDEMGKRSIQGYRDVKQVAGTNTFPKPSTVGKYDKLMSRAYSQMYQN